VDAPKRDARRAKNIGKETSQKNAAVRKPRGLPIRPRDLTMQPLLFPLDNILLWILECQHRRLCSLMSLLFHLQTSIQRRNIMILPRARLLLHTRAISNITTIPLSVNKLHGSIPCTTVNKGIWSNLNFYLDSPAQAGRTYINNGCNPLQEFDPNLRSSMQGFVRHHPDH